MRFVLDASVSLAWFVDHPVAHYASRVKQLLETGSRAVVPALWHLEMANGFAQAERRGVLTAADADQCVVQVEQLLGRAIESESDLVPLRQTHATARTFALSAYGAVYLHVAKLSGLGLATLDQALRIAATRAGVEILR
jgi:predicted nucleic acid-binding protein